MVIKPVINQAAMSQPELPTYLVMEELTINIPEPIIPPATIIVASNALSLGLKSAVSVSVFAIMRYLININVKIKILLNNLKRILPN